MSNGSVRSAGPGDVPRLRDLVRAAYAGYVPRIGQQPAPMSSDYAALVAAEQVWVAMVEGEPAGLVVLQPKTDHMFLENLAVHPDQQGRGIGSWLLAFAEDRARGLGLPELRLYTNEAMVENLAYYSRRGYREDRRATEDGFHRVFFVKRLVEPAAADRQG